MRSTEELEQKERELAHLRQRVALLEQEVADARRREQHAAATTTGQAGPPPPRSYACNHSLSKEQVQRYSRHLLLPSFGLNAQERLCKGSVLIVGCGGLGSPAALYLAASGVGTLGLVDHDVVDLSNLHRQIIHTEARVGVHKATSAAQACAALSSLVKVNTHMDGFNPANALEIVRGYDVVLDATDNPATRYLINDACVVLGKPLVSAAAVGTDGQLTVYNYGEDAPCYRCLFPESPAPENCSRCADAGVLGPVPGAMGVLQAIEVVKLLGGVGDVLAKKLLIFDALAGRFTTVRLRGRRTECVACGSCPAITRDNLAAYDYVAFTGQAPTDAAPSISVLPPSLRVTPQQLQALISSAAASGRAPPAVLDVRPASQFCLMHLPHATHIPFEQLDAKVEEVKQLIRGTVFEGRSSGEGAGSGEQSPEAGLYVMCRRGNNSQLAVARLRELGVLSAVDVVGGMENWAESLDPSMPVI
uniref:Adenylyltransferase and sulfurtransferase MOCS3 n=1 Tax=Dunaliella tertiolecta TaxID=3047 RepID=A0A7S3QLN7_DUNTE